MLREWAWQPLSIQDVRCERCNIWCALMHVLKMPQLQLFRASIVIRHWVGIFELSAHPLHCYIDDEPKDLQFISFCVKLHQKWGAKFWVSHVCVYACVRVGGVGFKGGRNDYTRLVSVRSSEPHDGPEPMAVHHLKTKLSRDVPMHKSDRL